MMPNTSLSRLVTDLKRQRELLQHAFALGVPRDYGKLTKLRPVREPSALLGIGLDTQGREQRLAPCAARAWQRMCAAAVGDGITLQAVSAFRSIEYQLGIFQRKLDRGLSITEILRVNAAPGYSEHHSGRALDITTHGFAALEQEFENSAAFVWLQANAQTYGFHLSFPRGNPHGISYEPWHWCWRR